MTSIFFCFFFVRFLNGIAHEETLGNNLGGYHSGKVFRSDSDYTKTKCVWSWTELQHNISTRFVRVFRACGKYEIITMSSGFGGGYVNPFLVVDTFDVWQMRGEGEGYYVVGSQKRQPFNKGMNQRRRCSWERLLPRKQNVSQPNEKTLFGCYGKICVLHLCRKSFVVYNILK